MKLNEDKFITLLRKSDDFVINEAFSKVKNAKVLATYPDTNSVIFQDPTNRKLYYANYKLTEDTIELSDVENFEFEQQDNKKQLKENILNIFSNNDEDAMKVVTSSIRNIIAENTDTEVKINNRITDLLKEEVIVHLDKPKYEIKNVDKLKESLNSLKENQFFGKFLIESEQKARTPIILESIDWNKETGKIFKRKVNYDKKVKSLNENKYSLRGFKKTQVLAKEYWKDQSFRKHLIELVENKTKPEVFCEMYKNITLLEKEELNEMLTKTLLASYKTNKIDVPLNKIYNVLKENKDKMLYWGLLVEQPPMGVDPSPPVGTAAGDVPPEAMDVSAEPEMDAGPADLGVEPDELPEPNETAELGTEEDLATEATEEVKIINALLTVIEDVFWNGNQENTELANLVKEIRDMRASGGFDEDRLTEIFRDLFSVTQQISTAVEEESPAGEELPPEEGMEAKEEMPEEPMGEPAAPETTEETPLETYV